MNLRILRNQKNVRSIPTQVFRFVRNEGIDSFEAQFLLEYVILLEPNYIYSINIEFTQIRSPHSYLKLKSKVRVDHDIVIKFRERGIVTALNLTRIDKRKYIIRLLHNPNVWFIVLVTCIGLYVLAYLLIQKLKPEWINTIQLLFNSNDIIRKIFNS